MRAKGSRSIATLSATPWLLQCRLTLTPKAAILPRPWKSGAGAGVPGLFGGRSGGRAWPPRSSGRNENARGAGDTVAGDAPLRQAADHRLLDAVDIFLDVVPGTPQIDQRIRHHLAR